MGQGLRFTGTSFSVAICGLLSLLLPHIPSGSGWAESAATAPTAAGQPLSITADRVDYLKDREIYEAEGNVVVVQGTLRLTADHATIKVLPGVLTASGNVHLTDPTSDVRGQRLELNVNTEAGVLTEGRVYLERSNTLVSGRLLQRFSEDHYRAKVGSFTNCDAQEGEVPAWRFTFDDLDLNVGDSLGLKGAWFCVNDTKLIPIPTMTYPLTTRRSGFLIPTVALDNRFGWHYQQSYFWAINPSHDLTIAPSFYTDLGYGGDLAYRYALNRRSRGQWFVSYLQQTELPNVEGVSPSGADVKQGRAFITGSHYHQVTQDLLVRAQANLVTDPNYFQQLSNSGIQRAAPSGESNFLATQRLGIGNAYLTGQFLQPLNAGGPDTFQRLPELGYTMPSTSAFGTPVQMNLESNFVNFYREQGFAVNRMDFVPGITTDVLNLGHLVGVTPQAKFREVYYTRGAVSNQSLHRETFWGGIDARSKLARRFRTADGQSLLHTIEPSVVYEYVPPSDQSDIAQIDQVDDLQKKNLLTYAIRSRLLEQRSNGRSFNWLDLTIAQSYRVGAVQTSAREFRPGIEPFLGTLTQPLQPATTAISGRKFSDLWLRAIIGNTAPQFVRTQTAGQSFEKGGTGLQLPKLNTYLTVDAFVDPYDGELSQWNTDLRVQQANHWYLEVGQRFAREGNRVRRGDIWNPLSFNEVYAPTPEIQFVTAGGGFRTPWGWTFGAKGYYDVKNGRSPEYDVVALYQNPCRCWSLGLYYLQFPDRAQYNFMLSLTGVGWTENFGTAVLRSILSPLLLGERGLPWASTGGPYGILPRELADQDVYSQR